MDYAKLYNFINKKMRMTHIYQPIMIKELLESDGHSATAESIAKKFIDWDDSLLEYYKGRVLVWPRKTLVSHGVVRYENDTFTLCLDDISEEQRKRLIELCDNKTDEYVDKYPNREGVKSNRTPITGGLRYDVIARAKGFCQACGIHSSKRSLDVDHIIPASMGGTNNIENLQALCFKCNRDKRNRDKTDFVLWQKRIKNQKCKLCNTDGIYDSPMASFAPSGNPDIPHEHLIFPKRHVTSFFDMILPERSLCMNLMDTVRVRLEEKYGIRRFDISLNPAEPHRHHSIRIIPKLD